MLQAAITILPIITGALYCFGVFYNQGFLGGFGIEETLFPISIDRSILQGFLTLATFSFKTIKYSIYSILIVFMMTFVISFLQSNDLIRNCVRFIQKRLSMLNVKQAVKIAINLLLYALASIIIFVIVANLSEKAGQDHAARFIEEAGNNKNGYVAIYRSNGAQALNGKPIICGSSYCAYWIEKEAVIIRYDTIDKIIASKPNHQTAPATANP